MKVDINYYLQRAAEIALKPFNLGVVSRRRLQEYQRRTCMERLKLAKKNGLSPKVILDGGAFKGLWTQQAAGIFPGAQFILVEPNPHIREYIRQNTSEITPPPIFCEAALGEKEGRSLLNLWQAADQDAGASLLDHIQGPSTTKLEVKLETIDHIAEQNGLSIDLLKLDLQGGELAALRGAVEALKTVELAVIEFSCLTAYIDRTTPRNLIDLMYDNDFCLYDVVGLTDRPYDDALMGGDFFFVKNSSVLRAHKAWS